jgi:hypothetical protein
MPITRIMSSADDIDGVNLDVFQVQEAVEVYDGALALAIDHLFNHIKALISLAYLPGSQDLEQALARHPVLRRMKKDNVFYPEVASGRSGDRILLAECQRLLDSVLHIAHLAAWPETVEQAQQELVQLQREVPFLDYRYDNDPYPSDRDHE